LKNIEWAGGLVNENEAHELREQIQNFYIDFGLDDEDYSITSTKGALSRTWKVEIERIQAISSQRFISKSMYSDYLNKIPQILPAPLKHKLKDTASGPALFVRLSFTTIGNFVNLTALLAAVEEQIDSAAFRLSVSAPF
jgi:hypothetical protein